MNDRFEVSIACDDVDQPSVCRLDTERDESPGRVGVCSLGCSAFERLFGVRTRIEHVKQTVTLLGVLAGARSAPKRRAITKLQTWSHRPTLDSGARSTTVLGDLTEWTVQG